MKYTRKKKIASNHYEGIQASKREKKCTNYVEIEKRKKKRMKKKRGENNHT